MLRLYFDHNVPRAVSQGLRARGVDLLTAYEDRTHGLPDPELLDRATALDRLLVSMDFDLVLEGERRQRVGVDFPGVVFAPQDLAIGRMIEDLELLAGASSPDEHRRRVIRLPLR